MNDARRALIAAVKRYATDHYTDGGWDVIVECFTDEELDVAIGKATTLRGALYKLRAPVSVWADRQADAMNSAF